MYTFELSPKFLLACVTKAQSFNVGYHENFDDEVAAARQNKRLMAFLDKRAQRARSGQGKSIEQVRKELGL